MSQLRIAFASSELTPFAKTGGLGDVSSALTRYLTAEGHDVRVFVPLYDTLDACGEEIVPVDFVRNVTIALGSHGYTFSLLTAKLPGTAARVYFVHCPELYARGGLYTQDGDEHRRFIFLTRAAIESCQRMAFSPHVFHANDWQTALAPLFLKTLYSWDRLFARTRTVLTIHNIGYQGIFGGDVLPDLSLGDLAYVLHQEDLAAGRIGFLKQGIMASDVITTVSPTYAREIQTETEGKGLDALLRSRGVIGILNGIDREVWNPETDGRIPERYSARDLSGKEVCKRRLLETLGLAPAGGAPVIGMITRLVGQKGIDIVMESLPLVLARRDVRVCVLGSGEGRYESFFARLQDTFPGRVCFYRGFSARLAALIEAGSDMFLMPSRYEPCGLNQMYSLAYGTVPIVRETGGLADTVSLYDPETGEGTGVVFEHYDASGLHWALDTALTLYRLPHHWGRIIQNGMRQDFSWSTQVRRYVELYAALAGVPVPAPRAEPNAKPVTADGDGNGAGTPPRDRRKRRASRKGRTAGRTSAPDAGADRS